MPSMTAILGAMGLDPDKIMKDFESIGATIKDFDQRLTSIDTKQDRIIALLEDLKAGR